MLFQSYMYICIIVWAEQRDEISLEYSGTSALKGDLIRYEKVEFIRIDQGWTDQINWGKLELFHSDFFSV
ncbi:hypothetical protein Syun_015090 [Stephania yunnanensis]|uniref:Uncharacterized protein n=1 Tax=Stephania yunnanensis TaxID=152371 RepID=A0AAP0PCI7_9MAGN